MIVSVDVGRKNLALCGLQPGECRSGAQDVIRHWTVTTCEPTAAGLAAALRLLPWTTGEDVNDVVIERQPHRNPTMTRLQHYIEMYFAMHDKPVTVQDAKHKLAFAASTPWWPPGDLDSWTYHKRKKLSVQTTAAFLDATPQDAALCALFAGSKKKDDFGDSLLQGMAFCHNVRPLELAKRGMRERVKARRPTENQLKTGRYSKPNLAFFFKGKSQAQAVALAAGNKHLARSADRLYGGVEEAYRALTA